MSMPSNQPIADFAMYCPIWCKAHNHDKSGDAFITQGFGTYLSVAHSSLIQSRPLWCFLAPSGTAGCSPIKTKIKDYRCVVKMVILLVNAFVFFLKAAKQVIQLNVQLLFLKLWKWMVTMAVPDPHPLSFCGQMMMNRLGILLKNKQKNNN